MLRYLFFWTCQCIMMIAGQQAINISATLSSDFFGTNTSSAHFGLRPQYSWESFYTRLDDLNQNKNNIVYRLFMIGRHGEGTHNLAERKYGSEAWDEKWSKLNGDSELCWGPDSNLTINGFRQAVLVAKRWAQEVQKDNFLWPTLRYVSPLSRAIETAETVFNDTMQGHAPLTILEHLRETIGVHTCDKRSSRSTLNDRFFDLIFDANFDEDDQLWYSDYRETDPETQMRAYEGLELIMTQECRLVHDSSAIPAEGKISTKSAPPRSISITSHSGLIRNLLTVINHRPARLGTAEVLPVLISAECRQGPFPEPSDSSSEDEPEPTLDEELKRIFLIQL